jgi:Ca2+/H+ antiporter
MGNWIQASMLGVQILALIGLIWYVIETMKIRKTAQRQLQTSLDLIKAATAQVEGMSKPCLTFWGDLRDGADAILEMHDAVGNVLPGPTKVTMSSRISEMAWH